MLYDMAMADGLVHTSTFHTELGWHWWELWHHEGRRARHGAAMQGPDYTHWHGLYWILSSNQILQRFIDSRNATEENKQLDTQNQGTGQ